MRVQPRTIWMTVAAVGLVLGWWWCSRRSPSSDDSFARREGTPAAWREYAATYGNRGHAKAEIEKLQRAAKATMAAAKIPHPEGLDPQLAALADAVDERVAFHASQMDVDQASFDEVVAAIAQPGAEVIDVAHHLPGETFACASGVSKTFEAVAGKDMVVFSTDADAAAPVELGVTWSAKASGEAYANPSDHRVFPGFTMHVKAVLQSRGSALAQVEADVAPGDQISYTTYGPVMFGSDEGDVVEGMVEGVCAKLGDLLLQQLTGRELPASVHAEKGLAQIEQDCAANDPGACVQAGTRYRDGVGVTADPHRAVDLFEQGCNEPGLAQGDACAAGAAIVLARPPADSMAALDDRAKAEIMLRTGCRAYSAAACAQLAALDRTPLPGETKPSVDGVAALFGDGMQACELGAIDECAQVAQELADGVGVPQSKAAAAALAARACNGGSEAACAKADGWHKAGAKETSVFGVALGKQDLVVDVRYAGWFEADESGVVWIASPDEASTVTRRLAHEVAIGTVRAYALGDPDAPPDIAVPSTSGSIYGIVPPPRSSFGEPKPCPPCVPDAVGSFTWPIQCHCLPVH
jgi:TPR repeat protein